MADRPTPPPVFLRIGAEKLTEGSGGTYEHVNPCTGRPDARIPLAGTDEVDRAVRAAHAAFGSWRRTKPRERRRILNRFADLVEANAEQFARLGALDNGMPLATVSRTPASVAEWIRYYAGWADKLDGQTTTTFAADGELGYTLAQPYGVIGVIVTWNGPLISLGMKIPPAIAAGNTVVVKPSELTPFSAQLFAALAQEAGLPPGVLNVLPGDGAAGAALVGHPLVKKVSFTGGPETARKIIAACAVTMKPSILELGGKSANIVFDDADLDVACAHATLRSIALMSGQGCALPTRLLVQETIYDEVCTRVVDIAKNIKVGDPLDPETVSGPVVNQAAIDRILGMIERAKEHGARLLTGGARLGGELAEGYFLEPTVFADVDPLSELAQHEVFGPVLAITSFHDEEEAIGIANGTPYELSGYVHTRDLGRALRVTEELEAGEVMVNGAVNLHPSRPFGGFGLSGHGKEGGRAGIDEFLRVKSIGFAATTNETAR